MPSKALSAVVAVVLLLMMTVGAAGMAYVFISGLQQSGQESTQGQLSDIQEAISSCMTIDSVYSNKVYLRNCGDGIVDNASLKVYMDDKPISLSMSPSKISKGEVGTVSLYGIWDLALFERHRLKIQNDATSTTKSVKLTTDLKKVLLGSAYNAAQAESYCSSTYGNDWHLFVPHSQKELADAWELAHSGGDQSNDYLYILGIYPKTVGANCVSIAMTSETCTGWRATDDDKFWVGTKTTVVEPNGDNCLTGSMGYYSWNADGTINLYNDLPCPGYTSTRFLCQKNTMT